ncbi:MAG: hypothetical protein HYU80_04785, partial [Candidatus Blackburnbacteria bacterium]|nr:hypothetical protein [Candidatus Blackburnbacteria bacterium]
SNTSAYQSSSGRAFYIGDGDTYFANKFNGTIDETRIYNYARSAAQIAWDYNRGAPIAYWKFDEGQGGTLYDSSGNSNNGTWNGAAGGTQTAAGDINTSGTAWFNGKTGKRNYSLNFDGGDDYVSIATSALGSIGPTSSLSLSAWVKAASLPSTLKRVISNQTILNDFEITMSISPGNKWGATIGKAGVAAQDTLDSTVLTADNWYYLVAVYNGNSVTLYVNGQSKATTSANSTTNGASSTNRGWTIANERYGTSSPDTSYYFFPGQIDDVRIYNYALTPLQVRLLYNNGAVNFSPSTGAP